MNRKKERVSKSRERMETEELRVVGESTWSTTVWQVLTHASIAN